MAEDTCKACGRPTSLHKQSKKVNHTWERIYCDPKHRKVPNV